FFSHATLVEGSDSDVDSDIISCNIRLYDADGVSCAAINKLQMKRMPAFKSATGNTGKKGRKTAQVTATERSLPHEIREADHHAETAEYFHTVWKEQAPVAGSTGSASARWLVFGSPAVFEQQLAPALADQGVDSVLVPYTHYRDADEAGMTAILEKAGTVSGIIFMGDYDVVDAVDDAADVDTMRILFHLLKSVSTFSRKDKAWKRIRFIRSTRRACQTDATDNQFDSRKSVSTGFLRSARTEFPLMDVRQVDFGNTADEDIAACLGAELVSPESVASDGPETLYNNGKRFSLMVEPVEVSRIHKRDEVFRKDKVFWIIGGTSGVGQELARYLAGNFKCSLVLSGSRRLPAPAECDQYVAEHDDAIAATIRFVREIEALGSTVSYVSTDVRSPDSIRVSLETIRQLHKRIDGIYFGALQLDDKIIVQKGWPDYRNMMDMRVHGVRELIRQTEADKLDFFVLFSSLAGVTGNIGQSDYAASTVYMDTIPFVQPADSSCRFISVQWGPWALGQQVSDIVLDHLRRSGFLHVTPLLGMEALEKLILSDQKSVSFVPGSESAQQIATNINNLRQGLGSRSGRSKTVKVEQKPVQKEEQLMSQPNAKVSAVVGSGQLQILMAEFEKQREMLMKLCENQNALLAGTLGGLSPDSMGTMDTVSESMPASPAPVPVSTPAPVPAPVAETVPEPVITAPEPEPVTLQAEPPVFVAPEVPAAAEAAPAPQAGQSEQSGDEQGLPTNLFEYVRYLMAKAVEMPETDIDPDQNIMELGADSMTAMSMVKEMETRYSIELPATLLFEYSTLNELVEFLTEEVGEDVANGNAQQA
ncbi:MAG: KR domain-containing protein, partial [Gammaproteobacteria bacterium]|nr:KR domain-containing protein [Gammaproteobacteria bacterium]